LGPEQAQAKYFVYVRCQPVRVILRCDPGFDHVSVAAVVTILLPAARKALHVPSF
jgi:hypothetical protein